MNAHVSLWRDGRRAVFFSFFLGCFVGYVVSLRAQSPLKADSTYTYLDRLSYGAGFSVVLGSITLLELAPEVLYRHNGRLRVGLSFPYLYGYANTLSVREGTNIRKTSSHTFGFRSAAQYALFEPLDIPICAHAEYEALSHEHYDLQKGFAERSWLGFPFLGFGVHLPFINDMRKEKGGLYFVVAWNLRGDQEVSPYRRPFKIRLGLSF